MPRHRLTGAVTDAHLCTIAAGSAPGIAARLLQTLPQHHLFTVQKPAERRLLKLLQTTLAGPRRPNPLTATNDGAHDAAHTHLSQIGCVPRILQSKAPQGFPNRLPGMQESEGSCCNLLQIDLDDICL